MKDILTERGLKNQGLIPLTPKLIERLNVCLIEAGIEPTKRTDVKLDGKGWSPEIAEERDDPLYLCNGIANPLAILVTPEQFRKPIYHWIYSWERPLMDMLSKQYPREIIDVTATNGIVWNLENGMSALKDPTDLPLLREIVATPDTGDLTEGAQEQERLIARFNDGDGHNALEKELGEAIMANRRKFGDLRRRQVIIEPVTFSEFKDFYTVAFKGAAVLRDVAGASMLILKDRGVYDKAIEQWGHLHRQSGAQIFYLDGEDSTALQMLRHAEWLVVPTKRFREKPKLLEEKRELLKAQALCDCKEGIEWSSLNGNQRNSLLKKFPGRVPAIYHELERFIAMLKAGGDMELSDELWLFLAEPAEWLTLDTKEVLWILLTQWDTRNILEYYTWDKNRFFVEFETWSAEKQVWAADYLKARYQPRGLRS